MTDVLHARLAELRFEHSAAVDGNDPVFVLPDGREVTSKVLRSGFEGAVVRCVSIPIEKRSKVTFHCLRHTAASLLAAAGVPLLDIARILGHSTLAVTMRYAHFVPESGRAGIEKLGKALAGKTTPAAAASGGTGVAEATAKYDLRRSA